MSCGATTLPTRRLLGSGTDGPVESAVSRRAHADAVAGKRIVVDA
ncbi:hypothetical protein Cus16_2946 [Curtobacterium sp. ER1/6]|nr:hypothetical protein Cus16_2946 [Curtobacterium sp. ER1/6]